MKPTMEFLKEIMPNLYKIVEENNDNTNEPLVKFNLLSGEITVNVENIKTDELKEKALRSVQGFIDCVMSDDLKIGEVEEDTNEGILNHVSKGTIKSLMQDTISRWKNYSYEEKIKSAKLLVGSKNKELFITCLDNPVFLYLMEDTCLPDYTE